eukprot:14666774-Alexandrium_andersonii.AAC.1
MDSLFLTQGPHSPPYDSAGRERSLANVVNQPRVIVNNRGAVGVPSASECFPPFPIVSKRFRAFPSVSERLP